MSGTLAYLDEQIEAVRSHLPKAMAEFDETSVHQARVATRRLKAGFAVFAPLLTDLKAKPLARAGRAVRRRLGPLRDLDVMLARLADAGLPPKAADGVAWVRGHFEAERTDARTAAVAKPKKFAKLVRRFDDWPRIRAGLDVQVDAVVPLLTNALHEQFDAFAALADRVGGIVAAPADAPPVDIHQLRIDGKAVRYAFELAAAHGLDVPKNVAKTFKAMQDSLGDWHDDVVLAERVLMAVVNADLPLHRPTLAASVLDVARLFLERSDRNLSAFKKQWKQSGTILRTTLSERIPLTTGSPVTVVDFSGSTPSVEVTDTDHVTE